MALAFSKGLRVGGVMVHTQVILVLATLLEVRGQRRWSIAPASEDDLERDARHYFLSFSLPGIIFFHCVLSCCRGLMSSVACHDYFCANRVRQLVGKNGCAANDS